MAIRTSIGTGDFGTAGTWDTGVPILGTDTAVIANGHNVTVSNAQGSGSKGSGIGIGISVQAGGTLTISAAGVLTVRGFDTTTNNALTVAANGNLVLNSGGTISVDAPSDWGTIITCNGNLTSVGGIFTIPSGNFVWSNASGTHNLGVVSGTPWDRPNNIYSLKVNTATVIDQGPISNSGGTGLGSFGNTSFSVISGGFNNGATANEVSSYANISAFGDYYMDYDKGFIYYKSSVGTLTLSFSYKYGTWFSYGIVCNNNATNSAISITGNTTINYAGMTATAQTLENSQGGLMIDDKFVPALNAARGLTINGLIFNHCTRPLHIYNTNTSGTATDAAHHLVIQNIRFNNCHFRTDNFASGLINHGYTNYVDHTNFVFNTFTCVFCSPSRGPLNNITASNWTGGTSDGTGHIVMHRALPPQCNADGLCTTHGTSVTSPLIGFAGANDYGSNANDPCAFETPGTSGHPNVYSNSFLRCVHRKARMDNWMTVTGNFCDRTYHHGTVHRSSDGYISNYIFTNNTFTNSFDPSLDETAAAPGGFTLGYNQSQWIDNVIIAHNTFDGSNRGVQFNDRESTVCLGTRLIIRDNIVANNQQGIRLAAATATNITSLALTQVDYNDDYANTTTPTNITQGTFMFGGVNYNSSGSKTAAGCYIFSPSYTLPDATNRSLVLTVAGTSGTTKSIKAAWGGGAQVEFVVQTTDFAGGQGTLTSATNPAGGPPVLTNSGAAFTTTGSGLKAYQVMIVGGTGSGQYAMVKSNTGQALTVIPNTANGAFAVAPDATSVYLIIKPHQTLTDSGAGTIICGMYSPELTTTNGTYTDANITIAKNYPGTSGANNGVNPNYVNSAASDFHPKNSQLNGTASDGTYIGALPVQASVQQMIGMGISNGSVNIACGVVQAG